jgi:hypothetical protein
MASMTATQASESAQNVASIPVYLRHMHKKIRVVSRSIERCMHIGCPEFKVFGKYPEDTGKYPESNRNSKYSESIGKYLERYRKVQKGKYSEVTRRHQEGSNDRCDARRTLNPNLAYNPKPNTLILGPKP